VIVMSEKGQDKYQAVLFLGSPGSGKGTQTRALGCLPGFYTFSTGEVLRNLDPSSELGRRVQKFLSRGDLVAEDVVLDVWRSHMQRQIDEGRFVFSRDTLLLDAYPRDIDQAKSLEPHVDFRLVIHLHAEDEDEMKRRLRRRNARPDDRDDSVIDHRFEVYHRRTKPLIEHFGRKRIASIEAAQSPMKVLRDVTENLSRVFAESE